MALDLSQKRVLIFIVAYNAEKTLASVLDRIPAELRHPNVEVLVIDDFSQDETFAAGVARERTSTDFKITMLRTPENQGYGGNQKLGYRYAIEQGFDVVALLHGDGQYAPEKLPVLLEPLLKGERVDAVFGSRMIEKGGALRGGMPLYKFIGNKVLTAFQNRMLGTDFSEFHSGYRLYATSALAQVPFERNSNDFHFDTEIIVQFVLNGLHIREVPIPTYYGDEICHVNGLKYAWDVCRTMIRAKFHQRHLLYDRKFDAAPDVEMYDLKLGYPSSHTMAIAAARPGARVLDIGCGLGLVAAQIAPKVKHVTAIDRFVPDTSTVPNVTFHRWDLDSAPLPVDASSFEQILMLDIIEHLQDPELFMEKLRDATAQSRPEIVLTTPNIGFLVTRFMLALGFFNYGRVGILDRTHSRLFTFYSIKELLDEAGYKVIETAGVPAPFPKALGDSPLASFLLRLNVALIRLSRTLFSYQIFIRAKAQPTVEHLLRETIHTSAVLKKQVSVPEPAEAR
jgi:glycosyltransferase involved in cell wall biosynthesis